jgi:hypothetical protein
MNCPPAAVDDDIVCISLPQRPAYFVWKQTGRQNGSQEDIKICPNFWNIIFYSFATDKC